MLMSVREREKVEPNKEIQDNSAKDRAHFSNSLYLELYLVSSV